MIEIRCESGQTTKPTDCERHSEHHWCDTCAGWYGVTHDRMHDENSPHGRDWYLARQCACRPCVTLVASAGDVVNGV